MANVFNGEIWEIDTAAPDPIATVHQSIFVKTVRWVGDNVVGSGGAAKVIIRNPRDNTIMWESRAITPNSVVEHSSIENWWFDGFSVTEIDGGVLYISMK